MGRLVGVDRVEGDPVTADIPVIMLTIVDNKQMGFALGAAEYLTKPIDFQRLHSRAGEISKALQSPDDPGN